MQDLSPHNRLNAETFLSGFRFLEFNYADLVEFRAIVNTAKLSRETWRRQALASMTGICQAGSELCGNLADWSHSYPDDGPWKACIRTGAIAEVCGKQRTALLSWSLRGIPGPPDLHVAKFMEASSRCMDLHSIIKPPVMEFLDECVKRQIIPEYPKTIRAWHN